MTREEAIKVAGEMYGWLKTDREREALETLIPEIRESEDERIRKQLIEAIKIGRSNNGISFTEEAASRYIAWLEKHSEEEIKKIRKEEYTNGFNNAAFGGKLKEWSEEDEDFINMLILHFNYLIDKGGDSVETYKSYREKLKSFSPQPHTVSIKNATKFGNLEYERGVKDGIQHAKNHQWKPSDEQMKSLKSWVDYAGGDEDLESLYNDLEKLK